MIFRRELADLVFSGVKTQTRRQMSDNPRSPWFSGICAYRAGQSFAVNPGRGQTRICNAFALDVRRVRLGDIDDDAAGAEGFKNVGDFRRGWEAINGSWNPDETVWLVEFKRAKSMAGVKQPEAEHV